MRKVDGLLLDPDEVEFLAGMLARATEVMPARWSPAAHARSPKRWKPNIE